MPWPVYALVLGWLAFGGWWTWRHNKEHARLKEKYEGPDLVLRLIQGKLPREQQRQSLLFLGVLFLSQLILALLIIFVMMIPHLG
jgi:hypothetical protein